MGEGEGCCLVSWFVSCFSVTLSISVSPLVTSLMQCIKKKKKNILLVSCFASLDIYLIVSLF